MCLNTAFGSDSNNDNRKTVCSITINSKDEIQTYKRHLPEQNFKFVELVTSEQDWLKRACAQRLKCDVVVMSGHFGGSFFGTNGYLALEEMEAASCDSQCDGIFHSATEVYMYGCNTLAGKNKDHRTPEEYIRTLRSDGYSVAEAQRIAAFLFSPFGAAFYSRMSKVFSKVPRIYGFDGKAPLGPSIKPKLAIYIKEIAPQFYDYINGNDTNHNELFSRAMTKTNATQIQGDFSQDEFPACYINSKEHTITEKVRWIADHITEDSQKNKFDTIPLAQYFFHELKKVGYMMNQLEQQILGELRENETLRTSITELKTKLKAMPSVRFQLSDFEHTMKWLTNKEFYQIEINTFLGDDSQIYSLAQKDFICSLNRPIDVRLEQIPEHFLKQTNFLWALACVKPTDPKLLNLMSEYLIYAPKDSALLEIAKSLSEARPQDPVIQMNLFKAFRNQQNEMAKWFMIHALSSIGTRDPQILSNLADALIATKNSSLASNLAGVIGKGLPHNPEIQIKLVKALTDILNNPQEYNQDSSVPDYQQNSISYNIQLLRPTDANVRSAISSILSSYRLSETIRKNLELALNGTKNSTQVGALTNTQANTGIDLKQNETSEKTQTPKSTDGGSFFDSIFGGDSQALEMKSVPDSEDEDSSEQHSAKLLETPPDLRQDEKESTQNQSPEAQQNFMDLF
jgi:hypothetical protein